MSMLFFELWFTKNVTKLNYIILKQGFFDFFSQVFLFFSSSIFDFYLDLKTVLSSYRNITESGYKNNKQQ